MNQPDHRTRVAAEKRERMKARLIESALQVFARKGADAAVIEDVIDLAGVSRGTFYNYYSTNEDLMLAVLESVSDDMIVIIDQAIATHSDPATRLASGVRLVLKTCCEHPLLACFFSKIGMSYSQGNSLALRYLKRDLAAGIEAERFSVANTEMGLMLVFGTLFAAIFNISLDRMSTDFVDEICYHLLLALGLPKRSARSLVAIELPSTDFSEGSLLARTQAWVRAD